MAARYSEKEKTINGKRWKNIVWKLIECAPLIAALAGIIGLIISNMHVQETLELARQQKAIELYKDYYPMKQANSKYLDTNYTYNSNNWNQEYSFFAYQVLFFAESIYVLQGKVSEWKATLEYNMLRPHLKYYRSNLSLDETFNPGFKEFCSGLLKKYRF